MGGFLPFSRAPLALDLISLVMLVVVPVLTWSLYLVRSRHDYRLHKAVQIWTGVGLGAALLVFEVDVRLHGWRLGAKASPYYDTWLFPVFYVHLGAAITTTLLWIYTLTTALKGFPSPPRPGGESRRHRRVTGLAALGMYGTAVTGWTFYWMAFIAR